MLLGILAGLAMLLAALRVSAVVACSGVQRLKEIRIPMALRAQPMDMWRMILRRSLTMVTVGLGAAVSLASLIPARRAMSVDPLLTLPYE